MIIIIMMDGKPLPEVQESSSNTTASRSPKQILQQDICQKYGWSCTVTTIPLEKQNEEQLVGNEGQDQIDTLCGSALDQFEAKNQNADKAKLIHDNATVPATPSAVPQCHPQQQLQFVCHVVVGYQTNYTFTSNTSEIDAYQQAIQGLQTAILEEEQKSVMTLQEFLATVDGTTTTTVSTDSRNSSHNLPWTIPIYDSHYVRNWDYFWSHPPNVVGIDTEGNNGTPPILVQIAVMEKNQNKNSPTTTFYCIIEAPKQKSHPRNTTQSNTTTSVATISANLKRLLDDTSIVKVFCDNFAHKDKVSLGIHVASSTTSDTTSDQSPRMNVYGFQSEPKISSIVDLESIMSDMYGPVKVARGLSRIVALTIAPTIQICKSSNATNKSNGTTTSNTASAGRWKNIKKFALIEQGKIKPITNIYRDLSPIDLQYAACDAYATLLVYNYLFLKHVAST